MCGGCANGAWHFFNIVNSKALLPHMQTGAHWHALSPEPACPGKIRSRKTAVGTTVTAFAPREPCLLVCSVLTATTTAIKMEENSSRWAFVHFPVLWHFHRFSAFPAATRDLFAHSNIPPRKATALSISSALFNWLCQPKYSCDWHVSATDFQSSISIEFVWGCHKTFITPQ